MKDTSKDLSQEQIQRELNKSIVQDNTLIRYQQFQAIPLTAVEKNVVSYLIANIDANSDHLNPIELDIKHFCEICGLNASSGKNYEIIRSAIEGAASKKIWIPLNDGKKNSKAEQMFSWISEAKSNATRTCFEIKLDNALEPYLLNLKGNFSQYRLKVMLELSGKYSQRLYEILATYAHIGHYKCTVDEFKKQVFATAKAFNTFSNLSLRVIKPSIEEINSCTDLHVEVYYGKTGRQVTSLSFEIKRDLSRVSGETVFVVSKSSVQEIRNKVLSDIQIPVEYLESKKNVKTSVQILCGWNNIKSNYLEKYEQDLCSITVAALTEMLSTQEEAIYSGVSVSAAQILEYFNNYLAITYTGPKPADVKDNIAGKLFDQVIDAIRNKESNTSSSIKNKKAYIKGILYNILSSAAASAEKQKESEHPLDKASEIKIAYPEIIDRLSLYKSDKYSYINAEESERKSLKDQLIRNVLNMESGLQANGFSKEDLYQYFLHEDRMFIENLKISSNMKI